jgi:hypothetical protein
VVIAVRNAVDYFNGIVADRQAPIRGDYKPSGAAEVRVRPFFSQAKKPFTNGWNDCRLASIIDNDLHDLVTAGRLAIP